MSERKFLFTYRYDGSEYGLDVVAATLEEAKGRVRQMSMARYDGEVLLTVPVPGAAWLAKIFGRHTKP